MSSRKDRCSCGLDVPFEANLEVAMEGACGEGYDFLCVDIVDPTSKNPFLAASPGSKLGDRTRPEFMLGTQQWSSFIVGKLSQWLSSVSGSDLEIARAEEAIVQELQFAAYLSLPAVVVPLRQHDCANLARAVHSHLLKSHHNLSVWVNVPLNPTDGRVNGVEDRPEPVLAPETWKWWNKFRSLCHHHSRMGVALEISPDLPDAEIMKQWLGEPVRAIFLPTSIFLTNKKGYPVLSRAHQFLVGEFFRLNCQIVITGSNDHDQGMRVYQQYISHLFNSLPSLDQYERFARGYEDYLQAPLQPLMDNLESATYETFEKDPVKYSKYEEAIAKCLNDRVPEQSDSQTKIVLMVLGAGRGPLVRAALRAAKSVNVQIKCYAVEKNANAAVTLELLNRTEWSEDDVTVVTSDMRLWDAPELADVVVSELLGSFGDNELSPECLDGAERFLKPDAVSIPSAYTSYMAPLSSQKLHNEVTAAAALDIDKPRITAFETPYVVRVHNYHELDDPQPVFTFKHPRREKTDSSDADDEARSDEHLRNARVAQLRFSAPCSTLLHGFVGYFHCTLYGDVAISIVPGTHSRGMFSWFPIFFPMQHPIKVDRGDKIEVHIWRRSSSSKVWYEWAVTEPTVSPIHNPAGRSYTIGL